MAFDRAVHRRPFGAKAVMADEDLHASWRSRWTAQRMLLRT
jgi:hypothetical protein